MHIQRYIRTIYKPFVFVLLILLVSCGEEEPLEEEVFGSITGLVITRDSNEPVEEVLVSTVPGTSSVLTDANGFFEIENVPEGTYSVQALKDGFLAAFEPATVTSDSPIELIFELDLVSINNVGPSSPQLISPENGAINIAPTVELVWSAMDDDGDDLDYTITLFNDTNDDVLLFEQQTDTTLVVNNLLLSTKYFWQVSADDGVADPAQSAISTFETQDPANSNILFVKSVNNNNVIYSGNEDGEFFQLTSTDTNSWRPRKNSETGKIAFLRSVNGVVHLFTMNQDGSDVFQVTNTVPVNGFNFEEIDFTWKPEGDKLLYSSFSTAYLINIDGSGRQDIFTANSGAFITEMRWSRFNDIIAVKTNDSNGYDTSIFTMNPSGTIMDTVFSNLPGAAGGLDLNINGSLLLYSYDISEIQLDAYLPQDSRLFIYDFNTGMTMALSTGVIEGRIDIDPMFSPDENIVIYTQKGRAASAVKTIVAHNFTGEEANGVDIFSDASMPDWE